MFIFVEKFKALSVKSFYGMLYYIVVVRSGL
jgi:hypothetical protein